MRSLRHGQPRWRGVFGSGGALRSDEDAALNAPEIVSVISPGFVPHWRRDKARAFRLEDNSTSRASLPLTLGGQEWLAYANINFSIYSGQRCNARCPFCVERLRPASRGRTLRAQRRVEFSDATYFAALAAALDAVAPIRPSVSITGGEPSRDPRLPRILELLAERQARKRTLTSNGAGLLELRDGRRVIDWIAATGVAHLNISRAAIGDADNARLMRAADLPSAQDLRTIVRAAGGARVRLSCVLLSGVTDNLRALRDYLRFAASLGIDNVVFRQLMLVDAATVLPGPVTRYAERRRASLTPLLEAVSSAEDFLFVKQIVGYYYYVEVWRWQGIDVVFEEADLACLQAVRSSEPEMLHELVFHPDGSLASTWQPWDGQLLAPLARSARAASK